MMSPPNKFLLALQFWEGDRWQADALVRYLADLEPVHNNYADIVLVNRSDCAPLGGPAIQAISRKFNLFSYTAPRGNVGWPAGCNSLASNTIRWADCMMEARKIPRYKAVFLCETDGAPVFRDWVVRMSAAWDLAAKAKSICVAGPVVEIPGRHMNGNLLVSGEKETIRWVSRLLGGCPSGAGWDWLLSKEFEKRGWANIPGMVSLYNTRGYTAQRFDELRAAQLIWIHGVKDTSLFDQGRKAMLTPK